MLVWVVVWVGFWIGYSANILVWVVWVFVWVDVWVVCVVWVRQTLACQLEYYWSLYISDKLVFDELTLLTTNEENMTFRHIWFVWTLDQAQTWCPLKIDCVQLL